MAKRTKKRKSRGLGNINADAHMAVTEARAGKCGVAIRQLYDAAQHVQATPGTANYDKAVTDFKVASTIVGKLCGGSTTLIKQGGRRRKFVYHGFSGARRRKGR